MENNEKPTQAEIYASMSLAQLESLQAIGIHDAMQRDASRILQDAIDKKRAASASVAMSPLRQRSGAGLRPMNTSNEQTQQAKPITQEQINETPKPAVQKETAASRWSVRK